MKLCPAKDEAIVLVAVINAKENFDDFLQIPFSHLQRT